MKLLVVTDDAASDVRVLAAALAARGHAVTIDGPGAPPPGTRAGTR